MKQIFLCILAFWLFLSFLTIPYNAVKAISEIKIWYPLTDSQKREKIFGDTYNFITFVAANTPQNSSVYIFSKDDKIGLISAYFLYPRKILVTKSDANLDGRIKSSSSNYVALYDRRPEIMNYKKKETYSSKAGSDFGTLYIKND